MKIFLIAAVALFLVSCSAASSRPSFDFANKLAQNGLWNEALLRWTFSLKDEGESAAIHNNMAVAYEQLGRFEAAEKEYQKALALDPGNRLIKANLEFFKKNTEKKQP